MPDQAVILTGFMGSGKSSVGAALARLRGARFIDLDEQIVATAGCSINEIFARDGEAAFRALESARLGSILADGGNIVLATGGGAVLADGNRELMHRHGTIVNLKVSLTQVLARLAGCTNRPLLAGDEQGVKAATMLAEREHFYADADIRIDTDGKSVEDVAAEIFRSLKGV